ncbi:MAG: FadR family transcriptional regulator [Actinomycetia bacterium]|nr:FadR family transcriptional regulator [Actinomycetes bacterium]
MAFQPISSKRTSEQILEQIKLMLVDGELRVGDKLPTEMELCELFNVSRTSVREALSALSLTGILEIRQGGGIYVRRASSDAIIEPLSFIFLMERDQLQNLLEVRKALEVEAAGLAAERHKPENLEALAAIIAEMEQDLPECRVSDVLDQKFHNELVRASQNPLLERLMNTMQDTLVHAFKLLRALWLSADPAGAVELINEHRDIYQAIANGDSDEARRLMKDHLIKVETGMYRLLAFDIDA